ncbi:hypothetical protein CNMCM6106_007236 [Aspergillus hiratsukae]|uniref:Uncharacterized protein n=1 Tax=Aspergillus hiratsukae TaxID=1194566 RepID=A0A8H6PSV0_9EURO|nr:hypothetical protein CNMCM6106_007236 [Aspergillus hiratsukae]
MHFSQLVTVASALALAPTAVVARQAAAAFVTVSSIDTCPKGVDTGAGKSQPQKIITEYTCTKAKISHALSVSYYGFDIEPITKETTACCRALKIYDNEDCIGHPAVELPLVGPANDRCIPERYFGDEVKSISMQLDCDEEPFKGDEHGPKQGEHGPNQEATPKQEAAHGSEKGQQAPERKAGDFNLGGLEDILGGLSGGVPGGLRFVDGGVVASTTRFLLREDLNQPLHPNSRDTRSPKLLATIHATDRVTVVTITVNKSNAMEWNVSHQATSTTGARHHELGPECVICRLKTVDSRTSVLILHSSESANEMKYVLRFSVSSRVVSRSRFDRVVSDC